MHKLWHYRLCPHSRAVRLALSEVGFAYTLLEERPWEWRPAFLAVNPAGELPVLELMDGPVIAGSYAIAEFIAEDVTVNPPVGPDGVLPPALFPGNIEQRAEVRRLVDWFAIKMHREVTRELLQEKVFARAEHGQGYQADQALVQACRTNLRNHLSYIACTRAWSA
jgi:glutathione S-transferase